MKAQCSYFLGDNCATCKPPITGESGSDLRPAPQVPYRSLNISNSSVTSPPPQPLLPPAK